ncbi:MAG: LysR family transcriptional regulator [Peptococcaceae bacterium]|nr:LysR family transcriptional regulator [Peptococcaceae bacterium]
MRVEQLMALMEVEKAGSMNAAAEKLFMTQQNLSKMLKSLENELGHKLFITTNRGIQLTEAGLTVLKTAQAVVRQIDEMYQRLDGLDQPVIRQGSISIELSPMLNISVMPQAYKEFTAKYPEVQIYAVEKYRDTILRDVSENPELVGILCVSSLITQFEEMAPDNVELIPLKRYPMYVMMAPNHPLADFKYVSLKTIAPYPLVVFEAGGAKGVRAISNNVVLSSNNYFLCEEKLCDNSNAIMYSFPVYRKRGLFNRLVHIPVSDRNTTTLVYLVVNKEASSKDRVLMDAFMHVFEEYL